MSHPAPFPPLCGAFCVGCKICCDLVDELDLAVKKTPGKLAGGKKTEQNLNASKKHDIQISHDADKRGKCSRKTCGRNVIYDYNTCCAACTCERFRKRAAHHTRSEKLHYMALCCIGKLTCCQRSISPRRRRGCHCTIKKC